MTDAQAVKALVRMTTSTTFALSNQSACNTKPQVSATPKRGTDWGNRVG